MRLKRHERNSLASYISWDEWGKEFGFKLYGCNDEWFGHFILSNGESFVVPKAARQAIDARIKGIE